MSDTYAARFLLVSAFAKEADRKDAYCKEVDFHWPNQVPFDGDCCCLTSPRDISSITEYGITCPLSRAVRVY